MPDPLPEFIPACPIPYILQPEERVKQLQAALNTDFGQAQRVNIEALIHLYEIGDLGPRQRTDPPVFLVDGVRVEKDPWQDKSVPAHALRWCEVCYLISILFWLILIVSFKTLFYQQMTQQTTYQANII